MRCLTLCNSTLRHRSLTRSLHQLALLALEWPNPLLVHSGHSLWLHGHDLATEIIHECGHSISTLCAPTQLLNMQVRYC